MKFIILTFLILISNVSRAQESFLKVCKDPDHEGRPAVIGLANILPMMSCEEMAQRISTLKSISELVVPNGVGPSYKKYKMHWTNDVQYMYGLSTVDSFKDGHVYHASYSIYFPMFRDFKNIIHISYLPEYRYYGMGICKILDTLPYIKMVTINAKELENPENDKCLSRPGLGVIIRDDFNGYNFRQKSKIIGLESYTGTLRNLANYPHLKYLSITNTASINQETTPLTGKINLTHFSMNSKGVKNIEFLSQLINIEYLQLTCIDDEEIGIDSTSSCKSGAYIKNLDFLQRFAYLRTLNLSYNALEDIDGIEKLHRLERLNLRGNKIKRLPSFSKLTSLRFLDLSGNEIEDISPLMMGKNAYSLNLSGNKIRDVSSLSQLPSLIGLNLSNNPIDVQTIKPIHGLKSLNLNGASGRNIRIDWEDHFYNRYRSRYAFISDDFHLSSLKKCETKASVTGEINLSGFNELEVLTLDNNNLSEMPDLTNLSNLRHLSLERNNLTEVNLKGLSKLEYLDLSVNKLTRIPDVQDAPYLRVLEVISNDITELRDIDHQGPVVLAGNNLIRDISMIEARTVDDRFDLRGNPITEGEYCPDFRVGLSQQFCPNSNIKEWNVEKPDHMDVMTWHESKKCNVD